MTPEIEVGTIASIDVAAALRCVSPSHTSAGTITVPPPMPNMPDNSPTATPTIISTTMPRADSSSPTGSAPNSRFAFLLNRSLICPLSSARSTLSAFEILEISDFFISPHTIVFLPSCDSCDSTFPHISAPQTRHIARKQEEKKPPHMPRFAQRYMHPFARAHCFGFGMRCPRMGSLREFTLISPTAHNRTAILFQPYRQKSYHGTYFSDHTSKSRISEHTFKGILVKVALEYILFRIH